MINKEDFWYAGRFARRSGAQGTVDVLAADKDGKWELINAPRKLFPKTGQVEISGIGATTLRPGDWLAFQVASHTRPRGPSYRITAHRMLPRYLDMTQLGTLEAARALFVHEGWANEQQAGHWAIRFSEKKIAVLDLARERDGKLRTTALSVRQVSCYEFSPEFVVPEPIGDDPTSLCDLGSSLPISKHDWSTDADYIRHVITSLAGVSDPRLEEIIAWLELHRDEKTGKVSATGANQEKAFEALRSGELADRLSADKKLMTEYLAAVRNDPVIAKVVIEAAGQAASNSQDAAVAALKQELSVEFDRKRTQQDAELDARRASLERAQDEQLNKRAIDLEGALSARIASKEHNAEAAAAARREKIEADISKLSADRDELAAKCNELRSEGETLHSQNVTLSTENSALKRRASIEANTQKEAVFAELPRIQAHALEISHLHSEISRHEMLTDKGKTLMEHFLSFILAGELPILYGREVEDFTLIAEALVASGQLIPFEADETVITPEDIWSRPGSGMASLVARAANIARSENTTFLVQLNRIDRSGARLWYPGLATLTRRGLLPRRLLLFATLENAASEEAKALSDKACRMKIEDAIAPGASLVAPGILSGRPAFHLDPGMRDDDLSPCISLLPQIASSGLDVASSMRVARVISEAGKICGGDRKSTLIIAKAFATSANLFRTNN